MIGLKTLVRRVPEPAEQVLAERPRLGADVQVHEPVEEGAPWIVQLVGPRYLRIGAGMAQILRSADGTHTTEEIARELGAPWTPDLVGQGLLKALQMRLLENGQAPRKKRLRWFRFVPPLTFQFALLNPDPLLNRVRPWLARLANRAWAIVLLLVIVGGLVSLAAQAATLRDVLSRPLPLSVFVSVFLATWAGTALHEFAHGAVLSHYGGRPSRMGMMLFYLTPAFFCDVSDGWRLPRSRQRVHVSLAGIATQAAIGGLAALGAAAWGPGTGRDALLLIAMGSFAMGVFNLLPFVKLDGYLALMSHLDISHLRDRSMADARRVVARILFGGRYERALPQLSWARWYGAVCLVFPLYIIGTAFTLWQSMLSGLGIVGVTIASLALCFMLYRVYVGANRLIREALAAGARRWRVVVASCLLIGGAWAVLQFATVAYTVSGGFVRDGDQITFVVLGNTDRDAIKPGATVTLRQGGVLFHSDVGTAVVQSTSEQTILVPPSVLTPVAGLDSLRVPAVGIALTCPNPPQTSTGTAEVAAGRRSLGEWLYLRYLAPFWR
jgi:putative peptide zinc metalloprotease protein